MTATLTKISEVARAPFSLLNAEGQNKLLEDCRFLLSARLPDDEVRDDTRMSFAAGRIAMLAPQQVAAAGESQGRPRNSRYLRLLVRTIHAYPEKLRLWTRALEYCRLTGEADLSLIVAEFERHLERSREAGAFLYAFLYRFIARQAINCLRTIADYDELDLSRVGAARYLGSLLSVEFPLKDGADWWFWPRVAMERHLMSMAVRTELSGVLADCGCRLAADLRETCSELIANCDSLLPVKGLEPDASDESAIWIYLWDRRLTRSLDCQPSRLWQHSINAFDPRRDGHSIVFAAHPRFIPTSAASTIISDPKFEGGRLGASAWQFEVAFAIANSAARDRKRMLRNTAWSYLSRKTEHCLIQFVEWVAKQASAFPYDPRVAEWT